MKSFFKFWPNLLKRNYVRGRVITIVKVMWRNKAYLISTLIFMLIRRNIPYLLSIRKENVHIAACATPFKFLRKNDKNSVLKQNTASKHF